MYMYIVRFAEGNNSFLGNACWETKIFFLPSLSDALIMNFHTKFQVQVKIIIFLLGL